MHVTVDDVNFCDSLGSVYVKYKSRASTARELPINTWVWPVKTWLLIACANSSGLQILGRRYDVHNNVAYIIATKS